MPNMQLSMEEDSYHLRFRPRAICGRRLHPNGGHRRPRPFGGVYPTKYSHGNPTSEPIGRSFHFLEQQSLPAPVFTGNVFWDASNLKLKGLFESVVAHRKNIHAKSSTTPKLKGSSSKVASMWKVCDDILTMSRELSHSLNQEGFLPYPEPVWFSSRELGMHTSHDITLWNECVHLLSAKANGSGLGSSALPGWAKDGGSIFLGSRLITEVDGVLPGRAKECSKLPVEEAALTEKAKESTKLPAEKVGALAENKDCIKLHAEEEATLAEKTKDCCKLPAEKVGALAENQNKDSSKLPAEEAAFAEKAKESSKLPDKDCSKLPAEKEATLAENKECSELPAESAVLAEKAIWPNWPSSFINWNYEKNFEKEQAEAEAREQSQAETKAEHDEWEGKAMRCLGA